ncbi:MAG: hypothetical protein GWP04_07030 [Gammaproteobacteria bacterium]|nr:hypothetical protein [Gammaproteobacteria bacterium]
MLIPDYAGGSLANLSAELELRLTGTTAGTPMHSSLSALIPDAGTYVVVLFDGLGDHQLGHPAATGLRASRVGAIDAVFPTTTSVNIASLVTAFPPVRHGLIAHQLFMHGAVVNTLKWKTLDGDPVAFDTADVLPTPNLWERLTAAGIEPITVQPGAFESSPLSRAMYRGCRFEPAWNYQELIDATVQLAAGRKRLILSYVPNVDVAAHVYGLESNEYTEAIQIADGVWSLTAARLPADTVMIGIADHGLVDYPKRSKIPLQRPKGLRYYGDPRGVLVRGPAPLAENLAATLPATWVPIETLRTWWGQEHPHHDLQRRSPAGALIPDRDHVLLPSGMDKRMVGYHGGLDEREVKVPLLVIGG